MDLLLANLLVSQQWMLLGEYVLYASAALSIALALFLVLDRWLVSMRGLLGSAVIEEAELIQTLPRKIWEVRLEIIPDDRSTISFHRRARWYEADFNSQVLMLAPGTQIRVRFRRAPRPLVMPAKRSRPAI